MTQKHTFGDHPIFQGKKMSGIRNNGFSFFGFKKIFPSALLIKRPSPYSIIPFLIPEAHRPAPATSAIKEINHSFDSRFDCPTPMSRSRITSNPARTSRKYNMDSERVYAL